MEFAWTQDQLDLRRAVIEFAQKDLAANWSGDDWQSEAWKKCADFGVLGMPVSQAYGGAGADNLTVVAALEALGYGCPDNGLLFALNAQMWACQYPIERFGRPDQKERYLPRLCDGSLIAAHAMSEPGSGSDAFALSTTAEIRGEDYVLNGSKTFVTNAPVAGLLVVFARAPGTSGISGITGFLVDVDVEGLSIGSPLKKMGLESAPMAEVFFDDVVVSPAGVLGKPGGGMAVFSAAMERERGMILASTVGAMERGLERSLEHARERRQFGRAIGSFQAVSHRLVEMKLRLETARLLLYRLAWLLDQGEPAGLESALVKLHLSESFVASAIDALQVHGGYGYMKEYGLEREVRDALASRLYSGTSEIQRNLAARHLGLTGG